MATDHLSPGGDGEIVEYAVRMKKLPLDKMLKILLAQGQADAKIMDAVAEKIARFHKEAQTGGAIDEMGSIKTIRHNHEENFAQTEKYIDVTIPAYQYQFIKEYVENFLTPTNLFWKKESRSTKSGTATAICIWNISALPMKLLFLTALNLTNASDSPMWRPRWLS